jgi:hypothetical protein
MNHRDLLEKLLQIERAIGVETNFTLQKMLLEAQDCLLELEKERVERLQRNVGESDSDQSILSGFQAKPNSFGMSRGPKTEILQTAKPRFFRSA